jgi:predicted lipid-binding transport protein (Tim44 family)
MANIRRTKSTVPTAAAGATRAGPLALMCVAIALGGFGGVLGDLIYSLSVGLLSTISLERGGDAAGLLLFVAGFASFAHSLGMGSRDMMHRWKRRSDQRWRRRHEGRWLRRRHAGLEQDPWGRREPVFDVTFGPAHGDAGVAPPWEHAHPDGEPVECEADFDLSTDLESRAIAQRFAPGVRGRLKTTACAR